MKRQEGPAWYDEEIEVDRVDGIPVLSISHSSRLENVVPPSAAYLKTIALGIRAAGLTDEKVADYLLDKAGIQGVMSGDEVAGLLGGLD